MQNSDLCQKANERLRLGRAHVLQWKPGDKAWLHCPQVPLATSSKLVRPWRGPVEVVEVLRPQCVRIKWGKRRWFMHPSRLKPFVAVHIPTSHTRGQTCGGSTDSLGPSPSLSSDALPAVPPPGASGVTGSRPITPPGDAKGHAASDEDSLQDGQLPPDGPPPGVTPCEGPAARTRAKMRRLL
ncbi:unnamed protein product [Lampetra fluviatilis]